MDFITYILGCTATGITGYMLGRFKRTGTFFDGWLR